MKTPVTFKIDSDLLHRFEELCKRIGYASRSECIRAAIIEFIRSHGGGGQ